MKQLVPDAWRELIEPLLSTHKPSKFGGRPRVDDRTALTAIMFVLKTGIPWEDLPQELGYSGMTAWRRLKEWSKPKALLGDRGYDSEPYREWLRQIEIAPVIARRAKPGKEPEHGSGLGVFRWVVENAHALINKFRRLRIRDDIRSEMYEAFLLLGVSKINLGFS
jgi:transposase